MWSQKANISTILSFHRVENRGKNNPNIFSVVQIFAVTCKFHQLQATRQTLRVWSSPLHMREFTDQRHEESLQSNPWPSDFKSLCFHNFKTFIQKREAWKQKKTFVHEIARKKWIFFFLFFFFFPRGKLNELENDFSTVNHISQILKLEKLKFHLPRGSCNRNGFMP